jgi:hypothetical protein
MAVFYSKERGKLGTLTGSIINWSNQLSSTDPDDPNTLRDLPAGYLRCDGSVYQAEVYPQLAEVLGVGVSCRYKKPDTDLLDNQFQVPDLGAKSIRTSNASNLGDYVDTYLLNDSGQTITKSGIGLEVTSNIGTTFEVQYQGNFFIPTQTLEITGQPGFTRATGNYTEESEVLHTAFQPHAHFHDGKRSRIAASSGNEFGLFGRNSYASKSTLCIMSWANNTAQPLCQAAASRYATAYQERVESYPCAFNPPDTLEYYGACWSGCTFDVQSKCLIPGNIPGQGTFGCATGGSQSGFPIWEDDSGNCGNIRYTGTMGCQSPNPCPIGAAICSPPSGNARIQTVPANYTPSTVSQATQVPFDSVPNDVTFGAINNVVNVVEEYGDECNHRHFVPFEADDHTFLVKTNAVNIPASDIVSTIQIDINEENKADSYIQPFLVQEFLIKY